MAILAWLHNAYGRDLIEGIRAALPGEDIREWPDAANPDEIDICIVFRMPHGFLKPFTNLKLMSATGAGVDHYLLDPEFPKGIRMVRIVDQDFASRMADYILTWTLFHHRDVAHFLAAQQRREWAYKIMRSAHDVRVGVMGLGQMGRLAAERLAGIGYDTVAWSRSPHEVPGVLCYAGREQFGAFLERTEILINLLPLTSTTRGILSAPTFARMPRGSVVISAGRGGHLAEADLLDALRSGQLRAATIDAFPVEPLLKQSPLWTMPNLYVTPHCSSTASLETIVGTFAENVRRFRAGDALLNEVDTVAGY
jgi:glyoxylate/hydroxypyruvate reductase A